jgi:pyruvate/2-oxoglutarate dehydrogenase complex dihydrolipoamide acyltransferase (E2) component
MPDLKLMLSAEELGTDGAVLVKWCKEIGDWVRKNEELAIYEVNGNQISFKSPVQGSLKKIFIQAEETFEAGAILGILRTVRGGT